ncbi:MAG: sulfatase-like hydrolase/transferase [Rhodobacterales bacterium]|nr:sulfatase-like hydrolase/transferase [Rhodobacterales bacterium]
MFTALALLLPAIGAGAWWMTQADAVVEPAVVAENLEVLPPPNIVVLLWDTARADRMSLYGHDRKTTPRMEEFAKDALVFNTAIAPSFWTLPSHASLFTGLPASVHLANANTKWLAEKRVTLAEWLGDRDYETYVFSANPNLTTDTNLVQGFQTVESHREEPWRSKAIAVTDAKLIARDRSSERSPDWRGEPLASSKDAGPVIQEAALKWLGEREGEQPWFMFLNYMEVHSPRTPSMASREAILSPEVMELGFVTETGFEAVREHTRGRRTYTDAEHEAILGVYDASMRDLDLTTVELLDALEAGGYLENTIVVLTSDHGESFGEHGIYGHNYSVKDTLVHVPLVIRAPGRVASGRVDHPVSVRDLFGTLITLAGFQLPERSGVLGNVLTQAADAPVYTELMAYHGSKLGVEIQRPDGTPYPLRQRYRGVVQDHWKLILSSSGVHALYDRATDPGEFSNLYEVNTEKAAELMKIERDWKASQPILSSEARAVESSVW